MFVEPQPITFSDTLFELAADAFFEEPLCTAPTACLSVRLTCVLVIFKARRRLRSLEQNEAVSSGLP